MLLVIMGTAPVRARTRPPRRPRRARRGSCRLGGARPGASPRTSLTTSTRTAAQAGRSPLRRLPLAPPRSGRRSSAARSRCPTGAILRRERRRGHGRLPAERQPPRRLPPLLPAAHCPKIGWKRLARARTSRTGATRLRTRRPGRGRRGPRRRRRRRLAPPPPLLVARCRTIGSRPSATRSISPTGATRRRMRPPGCGRPQVPGGQAAHPRPRPRPPHRQARFLPAGSKPSVNQSSCPTGVIPTARRRGPVRLSRAPVNIKATPAAAAASF